MDKEWLLSWNDASGGFLLPLLEIVRASDNGLWDKDLVRALVSDAERHIDSIRMPERASTGFLRWSGWARELLAIIHLKLVDNPATIAQYGSIPDVLIDSPVANPTEAMPQANPYTYRITTDIAQGNGRPVYLFGNTRTYEYDEIDNVYLIPRNDVQDLDVLWLTRLSKTHDLPRVIQVRVQKVWTERDIRHENMGKWLTFSFLDKWGAINKKTVLYGLFHDRAIQKYFKKDWSQLPLPDLTPEDSVLPTQLTTAGHPSGAESMPQANPYTITTDSFGDVMRKYKHAIENTDDVPKKWKDIPNDMQKHNLESLGEMLTNVNHHFVVQWAKSRSITLRGNHEAVAHWWNRLGRASQIELWHFANYNMV